MTFPSAGWAVSFDRIEAGSDVMLTATRPDPGSVHAQGLVAQRIDTTIPTSRACRVYARTRDARAAAADEYSLVAAASAR